MESVVAVSLALAQETAVDGLLQRYEAYIQRAPVGVIEWNLDFTIRAWNPEAERIFGFTEGEALGRSGTILLPESVRNQVRPIWEALIRGHGGERSFNQNLHKSGALIDCEWYNASLRDGSGSVTGVLSLVQDVTSQRRVTHQLEQTLGRTRRMHQQFLGLTRNGVLFSEDVQAAFRLITEVGAVGLSVARVGIWRLSDEHERLICEDLFSQTETLHSRMPDLQANVAPRYFQAIKGEHIVAAEDAIADRRTSEFAESYLRPLGIQSMLDVGIRVAGTLRGVICFEHVGHRRSWGSDECVFAGALAEIAALVFESNDRRRLERELAEARRLEALGTLASGIAHDFNNLLVAILGNSELLQRQTLAPHLRERAQRSIFDAAIRARDLVQQILLFGKRREIRRETVLLQPLLEEVRSVVSHHIPGSVPIILESSLNSLAVSGDASQLHQAFVNLFKNAAEAALSTGGSVTVRGAEIGDSILIEVIDTGCGISKGTLDRIFEPFFTTKQSGRGVGLGLAIVYGIVASHDGRITALSEEGQGTTMEVVLPRSTRKDHGQLQREELQQRGQCVVVIDDDPDVLSVLGSILESLGIEARCYESCDEALELLRLNPGEVSAVLTDLNMGKRNGREVVRAVRLLAPQMRVIVLSGELLPTESLEVDGEPVEILAKPFIAGEIARLLSRTAPG